MGLIISTAFWPSISFCRTIRDQKAVVDLGEHFVKQSGRSRCEILGPNGVQKLIVPLKKWRDKTPTGEIRISYDHPWKKQHWKSIEAAYRSSPYFEYYESALYELLFDREDPYLWELNDRILRFILSQFMSGTTIEYSSGYLENMDPSKDFREGKFALDSAKPYIQVFSDRHDFVPDLSLLDLICNEGPNACDYLE